jgi:hypothetical protein
MQSHSAHGRPTTSAASPSPSACDPTLNAKVDQLNHHDQLPALQPQLLQPQLSSILLQIEAPPHSFLAFAADDCDDGDIPSLALMRPAKLQSKYKLSPQQALHFVTLCSATVVPPPAQPGPPAVVLSIPGDLPPLIQVDLDSIDAVCAQPSRARALSPRRTIAPPPPVDPRPLLDALHLKIVKRLVSGLVWLQLGCRSYFDFSRFQCSSAQAWRRWFRRRLSLPQRGERRRLRCQNRARVRVGRRG